MLCIPSIAEPERYTNICFTSESFVELKSNEVLDICMQYPLLGMKNAENRCFVRQEVYNKLLEATRLLPTGFKFKILDAWRPFLLQYELYEKYSTDIIKEFKLEEYSEEQRNEVISKFVSIPVIDINVPPVHTTGGAIDLTIIDDTGIELNMGSYFDEFSDRTYTTFFEKGSSELIRDNRRLLYNIMTSVGFTNLPSEWWHYDYGDRFWAYYNRKPAIYKGVFTKVDLIYNKI